MSHGQVNLGSIFYAFCLTEYVYLQCQDLFLLAWEKRLNPKETWPFTPPMLAVLDLLCSPNTNGWKKLQRCRFLKISNTFSVIFTLLESDWKHRELISNSTYYSLNGRITHCLISLHLFIFTFSSCLITKDFYFDKHPVLSDSATIYRPSKYIFRVKKKNIENWMEKMEKGSRKNPSSQMDDFLYPSRKRI